MFVHLHNHSRYSPLDGLITLQEWIEIAKKNAWPYLCLTDSNGVYGAMNFIELCQENNIRPIVGCAFFGDEYYFTSLAMGKSGLSSLYHLISYHHQSPSKKLMIKELSHYQTSVVTMTDDEEVINGLNQNIFFELTPGFYQDRQVKNMQKKGVPLLGTYRTRMVRSDDFYFYRLLRAIKENRRYSEIEYANLLERFCYLPTKEKMERDFHLYPEACSNTIKVAQSCQVTDFSAPLIFPSFNGLENRDAENLLWEKCIDGIGLRYQGACEKLLEQVRARLSFEFEVIREKGFCSYFLVVADIVAQSQINCGRGSGASSIVCYLLGITHVEPLEHHLFFDRFLNRERMDPPDIDIDFPWDERDEIFDYVFELYHGHAAFVANHNFLRERQAIREVAKTYGVGDQEISHVLDRLHQMDLDRLSSKWKMIVHHGLKLVGCLHHLSVHCGGVVITPKDITNYAPVQTLPKGYPVIQWEKDQAEMSGLVKIDLLGNRSLAVIRDTIEAVNFNTQKTVLHYDRLQPIGDQKVEALICSGHTMGVFYIESPGTRLFLKKMQSAEFEHGVIAGSIIRPAANKMANEFVRRLRGGKWKPLHPLIEEVLRESFGLMIYQEHVNLVAMALSDFSSQEGNELRKVLGKKHKEKKLAYFKERFFQGARKNRVSDEVTEKIWQMIQSFAGYSFCKAHSASYCLVSFKSCYLKSHYPAEFMASVVSNQGGYYTVEAYLDEVRRMGLKVLPPCVQSSEYHYCAEGAGIRVGLIQIKGIPKKTLEKVFKAREDGHFVSLEDFFQRTQISFTDAKKLCRARCLNQLAPEKEWIELMWGIYFYYTGGHLPTIEHKKPCGDVMVNSPAYRSYEKKQVIKWEQESLGGFITFPQWALFEHLKKSQNLQLSSEIPDYLNREIILFGSFVTIKKTRTKKKETMCFCSFSDPKGIYETVFFPNEYYLYADILYEQKNYLIRGAVLSEMGAITVQVKEIKLIDWESSDIISA